MGKADLSTQLPADQPWPNDPVRTGEGAKTRSGGGKSDLCAQIPADAPWPNDPVRTGKGK